MKKLIADHEAKLADLDATLARIKGLEQQIMELENAMAAYESPRGC